jgi:hypothetical protein
MTILCLTIDTEGDEKCEFPGSIENRETVYFNKQTNDSKRLEKVFEMMSSFLQTTWKSFYYIIKNMGQDFAVRHLLWHLRLLVAVLANC